MKKGCVKSIIVYKQKTGHIEIILLNKIQMKINFDELFNMNKSPSTENFKKTSNQSQATTAHGMYQKFQKSPLKISQLQSSVESQPLQLVNSKFSKNSDGEIKRILQSNRQQGNSYKWYKETKFEGEPVPESNGIKNKKPKVMTKKQMMQMTNRLSQRPEHQNKKCKQAKDIALLKKSQEELSFLRSPIKNSSRKVATQANESTKNKPKPHDRLYQQYKSREFKQHELILNNSREQKQNFKRKMYKNEAYTQKYVPYFSRYNEQLDKRRRRQLYYQNNIIVNEEILKFSPNVTNSMRTLDYVNRTASITPKKQKNQIKGSAQMKILRLGSSLDTSFNNSLQKSFNKSVETVLNRSLEIVQKKQQDLICRLVKLFDQNGYFQIKPESVEQLDELEFQAFFPLIANMQKHSRVSTKQFQSELRQYFESLPSFYKFNLRTSQREKQKQTKQNMKSIQRITFKDDQAIKSSRVKMKNSNIPTNDYLYKLQNYV